MHNMSDKLRIVLIFYYYFDNSTVRNGGFEPRINVIVENTKKYQLGLRVALGIAKN